MKKFLSKFWNYLLVSADYNIYIALVMLISIIIGYCIIFLLIYLCPVLIIPFLLIVILSFFYRNIKRKQFYTKENVEYEKFENDNKTKARNLLKILTNPNVKLTAIINKIALVVAILQIILLLLTFIMYRK